MYLRPLLLLYFAVNVVFCVVVITESNKRLLQNKFHFIHRRGNVRQCKILLNVGIQYSYTLHSYKHMSTIMKMCRKHSAKSISCSYSSYSECRWFNVYLCFAHCVAIELSPCMSTKFKIYL